MRCVGSWFLISIVLWVMNTQLIKAQQLHYYVSYDDTAIVGTIFVPMDSSHIFYADNNTLLPDSIRQFWYDDIIGIYEWNSTERFFYDGQGRCVKKETHFSSGSFIFIDTLYFGTNGIDSIIRWNYDPNAGTKTLTRKKVLFYTGSRLDSVYTLLVNAPNTIDTFRAIIKYTSDGKISQYIYCSTMNNASCTDTSHYFYNADGLLELFIDVTDTFKAIEYDTSFDLFTDNILTATQLNGYLDPEDLVASYLPFVGVKRIEGLVDIGDPILRPLEFKMYLVNSSPTERTEETYFRLFLGIDTIEMKERYYYKGNGLPSYIAQTTNTNWDISIRMGEPIIVISSIPISSIELFSTGGALVDYCKVNNNSTFTLNKSTLPEGLYILKILNNEGGIRFVPIIVH